MSAFHAKRPDTEVTVLEAQEKPGKKLLATGNGKCNLTYASREPVLSYRGTGQDFTEAALQTFDQERTVQFFEELGMLMHGKKRQEFTLYGSGTDGADAFSGCIA